MNLPTILILALIGIALFAALRSMKKHPSGCSGHCSGCPVQPVRSKSGQAAVYQFLKKEGRHSAHPLNGLNYLLK